jgi:zinc transport system ATP-binding protein
MNDQCSNECLHETTCGRCSTHVENLTVRYNGTIALDSVSFDFRCGELTAVIGPNGGGKSSLLKAILGQVAYSGTVRFCAHQNQIPSPRIGYVPQKVSIQQDSPITVCDLMLMSQGYSAVWLRLPKKKKLAMAGLLERVSAQSLIDRKVGELSGGELQRVLLACSLNPMPDILLFDEPVSGVDVKGLESFYEIICDLRKTNHLSIILVSHDIAAVARHADTFILLNRRVLALGTPGEVIAEPAFLELMGPLTPDLTKNHRGLHQGGLS